MADIDKAYLAHLSNIEVRYEKSMQDWCQLLAATGYLKHGEMLGYLKSECGFSHGDANAVAHHFRGGWSAPNVSSSDTSALLADIYAGPKAALLPIHLAIMEVVD